MVQILSGTDVPFCFMRERVGLTGAQHMEHEVEAKTTEGREERKREVGVLVSSLEPLTLLIT